jgi:hypothetical protein
MEVIASEAILTRRKSEIASSSAFGGLLAMTIRQIARQRPVNWWAKAHPTTYIDPVEVVMKQKNETPPQAKHFSIEAN